MQNRLKIFSAGIFLFLAIFLSVGSVHSAEKNTAGRVTVNFQDVEIQTVINSVSRITGRTFIVDPRVTGKVTVVATQEVDEEEIYPIFLSVLQIHEFAAIEENGVTKIVPLARVKHDSADLSEGNESEKPLAESMVTRLYKLKHLPAEKLVSILRPLVPTKSYLAAQIESNMLIISDRAANIERLIKIVERIDQARSGEIEVVRLEHADAGDVVRVIEGLEGAARKGAPPGDDLRLIADERTNAILLSGNEFNVIKARALISHLDTPVETEGATRVVFLRYARAKDLLPILKGVEEGKKEGEKNAQVQKRTDFNIQADETTNALIITAQPSVMKEIQSVINKLDIRRTQVLIEAIIAEVSTDKGAELGVQWRATDVTSASDEGVIGGTNFIGGEAAPGGINGLSADVAAFGALSGFNLGYMKGTVNILGSEILNLGALISALEKDGNTNILSTPSLVTLDNEEAEITVGDNVPFATGSYTSTGNNNPENPFTTYERKDVGIKLKVTPQINEGDSVRLGIEQEVSNLASTVSSTNIGLQTTKTRMIRTTVMVEDGKILVLGGLISDDIQDSVFRVPILGRIPILGWLFSYKKSSHEKKNLMVFLRPTILRDNDTGNRITFDKYDYMRRLQQDFNDKGVSLLPDTVAPVLPEKGKAEE
ncbi:MAG: type II secretion system secretin GspD [Proteobacteria bacterium]|nr:type II secretion system secretin GspD [Pseudomonadota bacterium]MBU1737029.1 type II secretion system secretin GspD [Pseudomonadota bacterium]